MLAAHVDEAETAAAYESLCLLYVALTRAKRAMYVVTEVPAAKSTSQNFTRLLGEILGQAWSEGDRNWFQALEPQGNAEGGVGAAPVGRPDDGGGAWVRRAARRPARTPSGLKHSGLNGSLVFAMKRNEGANFGTAVHERFAEVEWLGVNDLNRLESHWRQSVAADAATVEALACLRAEALAGYWRRPSAPVVEVWRERSFEMVVDGSWVTGIFDRVVVTRDEQGRAQRASVIDFKTDQVASPVEVLAARGRHSDQLNLYRRVVAVLTGLAIEDVDCSLIFTRLRQAVVVGLSRS